jgi:hypothetical protein
MHKDFATIEREFHGLANPFLFWHILPRPAGTAIPPWWN